MGNAGILQPSAAFAKPQGTWRHNRGNCSKETAHAHFPFLA